MATAIDFGGTLCIGGELNIHRMGFGAMRLLGEHAFGPPADWKAASQVLRRAIELGIDFIDTADAYGPYLNEAHIARTLRPYPKDLVIATKGSSIRSYQRATIHHNSTPAYLREAIEGSLRRLKIECIDLYQVHRLDGETPVEDTVGALCDLRSEGKLRQIGLSEVSVEHLARARVVGPIATVQNRYNLLDRQHDDVLKYCEAHSIGFIPWFPLGAGNLTTHDGAVAEIAKREGVTPTQIALAWLLAKSSTIILIPGTSSSQHLEQNVLACGITLNEADFEMLDRIGTPVAKEKLAGNASQNERAEL